MILKYSALFLVFVLIFGTINAMDHRYCDDLVPQVEVNIALIQGVWFGVEYISHSRDPYRVQQYHKTQADDTCFFIDIKEVHVEQTTPSYYAVPTTPQYQYKLGPRGQHVPPEQRLHHLVLQWDEPGKVLDYHVKLNMSRRGFWISTAPQNAAYLPDMYNHFAGTIQVLKAVENHLVLSFCQRLPEPQLFTVILSRQLRQLTEVEIIEIHSLLTRKRLSTSAVKKVCTNAAVGFGTGLQSIALALLSSMLSRM